jgi:hypothetical protein
MRTPSYSQVDVWTGIEQFPEVRNKGKMFVPFSP